MRKGFHALSASKTFLGTFALIVTSALSGADHKDSNRTTGSHPVSTYVPSSPNGSKVSKPVSTPTKSTGFFSSFFGGSHSSSSHSGG